MSPSLRCRRLATVVALGTIAFTLGALGACGGTTDPRPAGPPVLALGETASATTTAGDSAVFRIQRPAAGFPAGTAVLFQVQSGELVATVRDSSGGRIAGRLRGTADGRSLGHLAVPIADFMAGVNTAYVVLQGTGTARVQLYAPSATPERVPAALAVGDTVRGEDITAPTDYDEFTFRGARGEEYVASVQATDRVPGAVVLQMRGGDLAADYVATASTARDAELETQSTPRFVLPADGQYTVRVTSTFDDRNVDGAPFMDYVGGYRLQLRRVVRTPERAAALLAPADTVAEAIDGVGDVDEFRIEGTPGTEYRAAFRAATGNPATVLTFDVEGPAAPPERSLTLVSTIADTALLERTTGTFTLPASGRATLRVSGALDATGRGAYRLVAFPVDRRPEARPATLALGDSVLGERIDRPGDVDEYRVTVPPNHTANLVVTPDLSSSWGRHLLPGGLVAELVQAGGQVVVTALEPSGPRQRLASGAVGLAAGTYTLRVRGRDRDALAYVGGYAVALYDLQDAPERAPSRLALGDTVREALDPLGDADAYTFSGRVGDHVEVRFVGGVGCTCLFAIRYDSDVDELYPLAYVNADGTSNRFTLPETATYRVTVRMNQSGAVDGEQGAYALALLRYPAGPERHRATVALGEEVTDEALDTRGDVDEFTLAAPAGTRVVGRLTATPATERLALEVLDPDTRAVLAGTISYVATESTGAFTMPAGGRVVLRVAEPRLPAGSLEDYRRAGAYRVQAVAAGASP